MTSKLPDATDVLVIGAGQAGLAIGYWLRGAGASFVLLDGHRRVGDSWRERYDSLVLFSSRAYSALPGLPVPGEPAGYPTKDEIADYLEEYALVFDLPTVMNERVSSLEQTQSGFVAHTQGDARLGAVCVIVAAGPFQRPIIPAFAKKLSADVLQFDATTYRRPEQIPSGSVLVVGDGATGRQVSAELVRTHETLLCVGSTRLVVPQRFLGRDIIACFETTGALRDDKESLHGRFVQLFDPIPGWHLRRAALRRSGVKIVPRATDANSRTVVFANGRSKAVDAVIWAIGYHDDSSWLGVPRTVDPKGNYVDARGVSPVPGLFHIGRDWQNNRASALLTGVGNDARDIAAKALEFVRSSATAERAYGAGD
ncbi:MAG TPA: NAD(P)/FAD-dependent oxidoreductase [Chthoniobacterales bacterium]|nr:NAD(P)/FAD-dependent oxidoreductase [Chthoniobacterales bacterium]